MSKSNFKQLLAVALLGAMCFPVSSSATYLGTSVQCECENKNGELSFFEQLNGDESELSNKLLMLEGGEACVDPNKIECSQWAIDDGQG